MGRNKEHWNKYMRGYRAKTGKDRSYRQRMRKMVLDKRGNKCYLCGYNNIKKLEIHHKDGRSHPSALTLKDIDDPNIILLCYHCHRAFSLVLYWKRLEVIDKVMGLLDERSAKDLLGTEINNE